MQKLILKNIADINLAKDFIKGLLEKSRIIAFYANMGAGKTTIIKAVCQDMGVKDLVSSPSFSIVNEYYSPIYGKIYHFDFYRIENIREVFDIGFEEYIFEDCIVFIEWPQIVEHLIPEHIKLRIDVMPDKSRRLSVVE
jgi:tRNA threonylcarbamoyladenosine biosynthesis protein TsaE